MLVVGAAEPELRSWLRAEGHATRTAANAEAALAALDEEPAELVIVDREPGGLDAPSACVALREDARLGGAWLLAITGSSRRRAAEPAYDVGADDYLHRPFTRAQLLARVARRPARRRSSAPTTRCCARCWPTCPARSTAPPGTPGTGSS